MEKITDKQKIIEFEKILESIKEKISSFSTKQEIFDMIIQRLSKLPHFHWTGIYEYDQPKETLNLHPFYIGLPTDHIHIPKGKGVCGTAVAKNDDIIVNDVRKLENYLACSTGTRSEIVVLIKKNNIIYGQIDVDSDTVGSFNEIDLKYLKEIGNIIAGELTKFSF